jgi:hypothetical protein
VLGAPLLKIGLGVKYGPLELHVFSIQTGWALPERQNKRTLILIMIDDNFKDISECLLQLSISP